VKNFRLLAIIVLLVLFVLVIPILFRNDNYILHVFILASEISIVALTVRLMYITGEFTFGQVAFVMFGAYSSALLATKAGVPFWVALPMAGILSALFALVIGFPVLRLKGTYFAILTLIIAEVMCQAARVWEFVGGDTGLENLPRPDAIHIGTFTLIPEFTAFDKLTYYYLIAYLLILTIVVFRRIDRSPLGATFRAIQQNDTLAVSIGINVRWHRILVFSISAFFSGLVGSFYAHYMTVFYPRSFSVWDSITYVLYAFLGGIGYLGGPILGSFGMIWLWEFMHPIQKFQPMIFAGAIVMVILFLPGGLFSLEKFLPSVAAQIGKLSGSLGKKLRRN